MKPLDWWKYCILLILAFRVELCGLRMRGAHFMAVQAMATTAASRQRVCFLTDVEGNWAYVRNFVRQSTCLRFKEQTQATASAVEELELNDDCFLVFGGDAGDKGGETMQCVCKCFI